MGYNTTSCIFDGIPCEQFGLQLMEIDAKGGKNAFNGVKMDYYTDKVYRNPRQYILGADYKEPLKFKIHLTSKTPIDRLKLSDIQRWLFGHPEYKKLQILQEDMQYVYFNCVLDNPTFTTIGNQIHGITCDVICDAPWAWEYDRVYEYDITTTPKNITIENRSDNNDYIYPKVIVTCKKATGTISIVNNSDGNREFKLTGLSQGETITVDNELQIVTSSLGLNRLSNFNKKFFRLMPMYNDLTITGDISKLIIEHKNAKKVGS